jgi:hypothetical protein
MLIARAPTRRVRIANMYVTKYTDRLYLASYTHPPDKDTPFPYPPKQDRSPRKRSAKAQNGPQAAPADEQRPSPFYFSIDHSLLYNAFHADFGPLHVGHLYRFAVHLHDVLAHPENETRPVVFWSSPDSRSMSCCRLDCLLIDADILQVEQMRHAFWHRTWYSFRTGHPTWLSHRSHRWILHVCPSEMLDTAKQTTL